LPSSQDAPSWIADPPPQSPVEGLQVPALRQVSPGQAIVPVPAHVPVTVQRSVVVHAFPSSHAAVVGFATTGFEHTPFVHVPAA
jgi:hypothetical protein